MSIKINFEIWSSEQRHPFFLPVKSPPNRFIRAQCSFACLSRTCILISTFSDNVRVVIIHFGWGITMFVTSSSQETRKYFMFATIFYWDYLPLHHSSAELVCAFFFNLHFGWAWVINSTPGKVQFCACSQCNNRPHGLALWSYLDLSIAESTFYTSCIF